jgi:hypothetical protein
MNYYGDNDPTQSVYSHVWVDTPSSRRHEEQIGSATSCRTGVLNLRPASLVCAARVKYLLYNVSLCMIKNNHPTTENTLC